ncbi:MAG: hypothetical protein C0591_11985 [Marinilabiliales bacterium]|nr:MAG: hypothetical protein C0591_11985 [Marinilabiliales bacterium]
MNLKKIAVQWLRYINILSLDVVLGSVMAAIFACKVLDVEIQTWWLVVIALTVWVMYTADHLLDAWQGKEQLKIRRHSFHFKHMKRILPVWITAAVTSIILSLLELDREIIYLGILLGISILIYFGAVYFNKENRPYFLQKELFIALIYVIGIWLAPIAWHGVNPDGMILMIIANLVLLAWAEGIIISWYEFHEDIADKHVSFSVLFGKNISRRFIWFLLIMVFVFSISGIFFIADTMTIRFAFSIELLMGITLMLLISFPNFFKEDDLYRYVGEGSFLLPALLLLI